MSFTTTIEKRADNRIFAGIPRHMPELLRFTMIQSRAP